MIKDHHEGIISYEEFERANKLLWQGVKGEDRGGISKYPLSRKLKCNTCGANFQRYKNREKVFWRCGTHIKSQSLCPMTSIKEEVVKKALLNAFFDKFSDGAKDVSRLINFLKHADTFKEDHINPLTDRMNDMIKQENDIAIHGDLGELKRLKNEKVEIEKHLSDRRKTLKVIEKDFVVRMKAIGILNELVDKGGTISDLRDALNDFWLLSAFIVGVTIHSKELYDIQWIDDAHSIVEMEIGE